MARLFLTLNLCLLPSICLGQALDPLTVELGKPFPPSSNAPMPLRPHSDPFPQLGGFRVPAVSSSPFVDFEIQVNKQTGRVVAVVAKRAFLKMKECEAALHSLLPAIKSRFGIRSSQRGQVGSIDETSGVHFIQLHCAVSAGSPYWELSLYMRHNPEFDIVMEPMRAK